MEQSINDFEEIYIENEYEHIYGYKNGVAVEIVEPHSKEFKRVKELVEKNFNGIVRY